jgi:hypothetical protein
VAGVYGVDLRACSDQHATLMRAYTHGAVEVTGEPTPVCLVGQDIEQCLLRNISDVVVYVGGEHVAASGELSGFPLDPGESLELKVFEFDSAQVWAVVGDKPGGKAKDDDDDRCGTLVFLVLS